MTKQEIINILRENRKILEQYGVKKIAIFGSFARNTAKEDSDIDLVLDIEEGRINFKTFSELVDFLENIFGRRVDILTPSSIKNIRIKEIKERIEKELEYV
ncbi:MAG: nucleotidyltransferase family protein [Brevinematia bacterium]